MITAEQRGHHTIKFTIELEGPDGSRVTFTGVQHTDRVHQPRASFIEPGHAQDEGKLYYKGQTEGYGRMSLVIDAFTKLTEKTALAGWRPVVVTVLANPYHDTADATARVKSPGYLIVSLEDALLAAGVTVHHIGKPARLYATADTAGDTDLRGVLRELAGVIHGHLG